MKNSTRSSKKALLRNATVSAPAAARTGDSFQNFEARIGYGTGNLSSGGDYAIDYLSRNRWRLEAQYRSSWICGKAVDLVAEDMTKAGIEINSEGMDPGNIEKLTTQWKRLRVWDKLCQTIKWARLYGGALAVMLIDGQAIETPLNPKTVGRDQFKGLMVLDRWTVMPSVTDLVTELGPDLGLPKFYNTISDGLALQKRKIHYSRVIRIEGQSLPYWQRIAEQLWGQSVLERLWDRLLAFDSTTQGAAQLVYKAHLRTYKVDGLRDIIAQGGPALEGLVKQIDFIRRTQTNEGLTLMDTKDEFEASSYTFGGLDTVLLQFSQQLSGALGIPLTKLFGQSPAGLNATGESDIRNYYDSINQEQESQLRPGVGTLLEVSHRSLFGQPLPDGTDFNFEPLWQMDETERATVAGTTTTAVSSAFSSGIIGQQTALKELRQSSRTTGVFTQISDDAIKAATDETQPLGEMGGGFGDKDDNLDKDDSKVRDAWSEGDHPRNGEGEFSSGGGGKASASEVKHTEVSLGRGIKSNIYEHPASPDATMQVVTRTDGYRSVSDIYVPEEHQGKGIGQAMYLKALSHGPILHEKEVGENLTSAASKTRQSLIKKGLAEVKKDEFGRTLLHATEAGQKAAG